MYVDMSIYVYLDVSTFVSICMYVYICWLICWLTISFLYFNRKIKAPIYQSQKNDFNRKEGSAIEKTARDMDERAGFRKRENE